jgi:hypothetical protein
MPIRPKPSAACELQSWFAEHRCCSWCSFVFGRVRLQDRNLSKKCRHMSDRRPAEGYFRLLADSRRDCGKDRACFSEAAASGTRGDIERALRDIDPPRSTAGLPGRSCSTVSRENRPSEIAVRMATERLWRMTRPGRTRHRDHCKLATNAGAVVACGSITRAWSDAG